MHARESFKRLSSCIHRIAVCESEQLVTESSWFFTFYSHIILKLLFVKPVDKLLPHSRQNISCLRSGIGYLRVIDNDSAEELFTSLLRQLNFWCECSTCLHFQGKTQNTFFYSGSHLAQLGTRLNKFTHSSPKKFNYSDNLGKSL